MKRLNICIFALAFVFGIHQQLTAIQYTKKKNSNNLQKSRKFFFFCFDTRGFASVGYLCDDFLNKHKRLIIEEFGAGFAYALRSSMLGRGSLIFFSLFLSPGLVSQNALSLETYSRENLKSNDVNGLINVNF